MFTAASIFLRMGNLKKKQSLIVVAILQIWDGLTRCDQPPPATLPGPRAGWHGTAPAPPAQACGVRSLRPRRPPLRLSVARRRPSPVPNVPHRPARPFRRAPTPAPIDSPFPFDPPLLPLRDTDPTNRATRAMDGRACSWYKLTRD